MRPLIFEYIETPEAENIDSSLIEYSALQNLTVLKGSNNPAIEIAHLDTNTFTKAGEEPSDSDRDYNFKIKSLLDTETRTYTKLEMSDTDNSFRHILSSIDTQTFTEAREETDSDL